MVFASFSSSNPVISSSKKKINGCVRPAGKSLSLFISWGRSELGSSGSCVEFRHVRKRLQGVVVWWVRVNKATSKYYKECFFQGGAHVT